MNKRLFFICSIFLLAIVPLLAGCDKDEDEENELIIVESFEGTDGMEGEKILFELEDVPAVIQIDNSDCVIISLDEACNYFNTTTPPLIGIPKKKWDTHDLPFLTKIRVSLSVTNVEQYQESNLFMLNPPLVAIRKAYLREIKVID